MNYIYKLTESTVIDENGVSHIGYGIAAYVIGESEPRRSVADIFTKREEAENFVNACNLLELDIDHLDDVVYDAVNA